MHRSRIAALYSNSISNILSTVILFSSFLKVNYNVECERTISEIFVICYVKMDWSVLHFEWIFDPDMVLNKACMGRLGNIGSESFADLPNNDLFLIQHKIITFINITAYIIKKSLKYFQAVTLMVTDISF